MKSESCLDAGDVANPNKSPGEASGFLPPTNLLMDRD
jgi:hypothetical protein